MNGKITSLLEELFQNSINDAYYFLIVLWVYKHSFKARFGAIYIELDLDAERADFIQSEIRKYTTQKSTE
jgi:hypothetical protein